MYIDSICIKDKICKWIEMHVITSKLFFLSSLSLEHLTYDEGAPCHQHMIVLGYNPFVDSFDT